MTKRADQLEQGDTIIIDAGWTADVFRSCELDGAIRIEFYDGSYITQEPTDVFFLR